jgi:hypothetical protein
VISNIAAATVTPTSERITWTTNESSNSTVEFGTTTSYGTTLFDAILTTNHSELLTGLTGSTGNSYNSDVIADGATAYWRLDESAGTVCTDSIGAANLTYNGSPTLGVTGLLTGDTDTAVTFNGTTQYAIGTFIPSSVDTFTLEAIVKWTSGVSGIIGMGTNMPYMRVKATGAIEVLKENALSICTSTTNLTTGVAARVMWTKSGATNKIYINGVDRSGAVTNATMVSNFNTICIGAEGDGAGDFFNGTIDEPAYYPTALSAGQATTHNTDATTSSGATTYHYRVKSTDAAGNQSVSADKTFVSSATPDVTAPTFSNIVATLTIPTATITWNTNEAATARVEYGPDTNYGNTSSTDSTLLTAHSRTISGITSGNPWHYRLHSIDASGNEGITSDQTLGGTILTLNPGATAAQIIAAHSNMNIDIVEFTAGTYSNIRMDIKNINRSTRPLTLRPAAGAAVVFDGGGGGIQSGFLRYGSNQGPTPTSVTSYFTWDTTGTGGSFTIQNYSIGSDGIINIAWVDHIILNGFTLTGNTGTPAFSHSLYFNSDGVHRGQNVTANNWTITGDAGKTLTGFQTYHNPNFTNVTCRNWTVTLLNRWAFIDGDAQNVLVDGWNGTSCTHSIDCVNQPGTGDTATGTVSNSNGHTSCGGVVQGADTWLSSLITNGGGNTS